jgi:putative ABC transport system permease protein
MALPFKYNLRNVRVRWRSTVSTVLGVALVVAVYIMMQMLAVGLSKSNANTGDPRNVMIVRKGSTAESSSQITLEQYKLIQYLPGIAHDGEGRPIASADVIILITLPRKQNGEANVLVRGISPKGMELRPQVSLIAGQWFTPGKREVVVSKRLADRFTNMEVGQSFKTGPHLLKVTGWMNGGNSAFDSEIWMDADEARSIFNRNMYSSILARAADPSAAETLTKRLETDKRLPLQARSEVEYYSAQTMTAKPIKFIGNFLAAAMSVGAVFAAMNTMYASVGARTREVGTLRVLGYRRRVILLSFLIEGALLALIGGVVGCLLALPMNGFATGMINFQSFSEVVFDFRITPTLILKGLAFSMVVGVIGSFLPALRAARLPVISSLKSI